MCRESADVNQKYPSHLPRTLQRRQIIVADGSTADQAGAAAGKGGPNDLTGEVGSIAVRQNRTARRF